MPLFEVAILEMPTKKEVEEGTGSEKLVFGPKPIIAPDDRTAAMRAVMGDENAMKVNQERMKVLVRPFA